MDFPLLSAVIEEASGLIAGARVDRLYESDSRDIIFLLRKAGKQSVLLVSPDRTLPRVHLISRKPLAAPALHPFTLFLRSRIVGSSLETIGILNRDRIVEMVFRLRGTVFRLLVELFGPAANLIVTDEQGIVQTVYYPSLPGSGRSRLLMPGLSYTPPGQARFAADGRDREGAPIIPSRDGSASGSPNREAEASFQALLGMRKSEGLRATLRAATRKAATRIERRIEALDRDRNQSDRAEEYRRCGDLILANLLSLRMGMKEAELQGPEEGTATVLLDPARSPAANAELYYKRYKKAKASRTVVEIRLHDAQTVRSSLEALLRQVDGASTLQELSSLQEEFDRSGLLRQVQGKRMRAAAAAPNPFRKISFRGWDILVGRNARGNDYLTTKLARAQDLWLHAEGMPGSHVLIRNPEGVEIPPHVLERAASLAAYYSRGRGAGKVPVTYTFARSVKKPKGAKPGLVTLTERKTIMAAPRGEQDNDG